MDEDEEIKIKIGEHGFIKLDRKILEWRWHDNPFAFSLFCHILLLANWESKEWHQENLVPGQFVTSIRKLSEKTGLTENQVRYYLSQFISTGELTNKSTSKFRIITVNNWDAYQGINKQTTNKPQTNHKQTTNKPQQLKNNKNYKKKKKERNSFSLDEIRFYVSEKNYSFDPERFWNHYEAQGWSGIEDFKPLADNWEKIERNKPNDDKWYLNQEEQEWQ